MSRTLVVDQQIWKWRVGRSSIVARCGPRKLVIKIHKILGITPDDYERSLWKHTNNCQVTPKMISVWISKESKHVHSM